MHEAHRGHAAAAGAPPLCLDAHDGKLGVRRAGKRLVRRRVHLQGESQ